MSSGSTVVHGPAFSPWRALKLGSFHIGSSLTDLLNLAVWNRVLIVELGAAAWLVALMSALRYLLAPLTLWAGHRSDTRPIFGSYRLAYIWLGRLLMWISLPLLPLSAAAISREEGLYGWTVGFIAFTLYGVGTLISGAPFLALVHDSASYERRGQAISIVQFILVVSFAFIPALYAVVMPIYELARFWQIVEMAMVGALFFWVFAVVGEERTRPQRSPDTLSWRQALMVIWSEPQARRYGLYLATAAFFAFMQDAILEPFGGDVFGLSVGETTRFNAYWGIGVLMGMVGAYLITRQRRPDQQVPTTVIGMAWLSLSLGFIGVASAIQAIAWLRPSLILFGLGFGIFTVGGASLLMAMSAESQAGTYLAMWSVIQLLSRGLGIAFGGFMRDVAMWALPKPALAYGVVFWLEALGLSMAILLLLRVDIGGFARRQHRAALDPASALAD
ncbi:MAG: BCD family MFS transporter [Anaerolineae bacterium]|nr:BCD family MFS transporter [Anaerolineae bacterium]MDW8098438.1 BCD family MFS transporter [Anaerolineae bacterium]